MWAERAVCRLLAQNVGSLALIVSLPLSLLAPNVGSWPLLVMWFGGANRVYIEVYV
jgi:hypothetical protein